MTRTIQVFIVAVVMAFGLCSCASVENTAEESDSLGQEIKALRAGQEKMLHELQILKQQGMEKSIRSLHTVMLQKHSM